MHSLIRPLAPGAIIGYRKNGIPIRLIGGGSEPAPEPPAEPAPAGQDPAPAPAAAGQGAPPANPDPGQPSPPVSGQEPPAPQPEPSPATIDDLPEWARKTVRELRTENAAARQKAKEHEQALGALQVKSQEQLDGIARALGLKPEEATPEQIMAERDAEKARADAAARQARAAAVELAVFRAASAAGVNANALLDSRAFVTTLDGMDPAGDGFAQQVQDKIAAAADANPGWKLPPPSTVPAPAASAPPLAPAPPPAPLPPAVPSSGPQPGSYGQPPAGPRQLTEEDAKQMSPTQVLKAINEGLFVESGFGPNRISRIR
jgi:hypothetical protein